ncbi:MAG: hypothetical protein ACFB22_15060 [Rhodothalassiaceae bacterium]
MVQNSILLVLAMCSGVASSGAALAQQPAPPTPPEGMRPPVQEDLPDGVPDALEPVAGQRTISDLLKDGFEIVDYELGTIRINRFQVVERVLLVKQVEVYTCTFQVGRNERTDQPEKQSLCVPVF